MITQSGVHIQTIGGECGTPTSQDIAVHAGRLCRFGGAVWYPLLPHLLFVGLLAYKYSGSWPDLLWGFLHDAHECVTNDIPRPFKCDCMRREQAAIDERLIARYFGPRAHLINHSLIKECDRDACDIEAVELGLPNYREAVVNQRLGQRTDKPTMIFESEEDLALFRRILSSPFSQGTISASSGGVCAFADLLELGRAGRGEALVASVKSWGFVDVGA